MFVDFLQFEVLSVFILASISFTLGVQASGQSRSLLLSFCPSWIELMLSLQVLVGSASHAEQVHEPPFVVCVRVCIWLPSICFLPIWKVSEQLYPGCFVTMRRTIICGYVMCIWTGNRVQSLKWKLSNLLTNNGYFDFCHVREDIPYSSTGYKCQLFSPCWKQQVRQS